MHRPLLPICAACCTCCACMGKGRLAFVPAKDSMHSQVSAPYQSPYGRTQTVHQSTSLFEWTAHTVAPTTQHPLPAVVFVSDSCLLCPMQEPNVGSCCLGDGKCISYASEPNNILARAVNCRQAGGQWTSAPDACTDINSLFCSGACCAGKATGNPSCNTLRRAQCPSDAIWSKGDSCLNPNFCPTQKVRVGT